MTTSWQNELYKKYEKLFKERVIGLKDYILSKYKGDMEAGGFPWDEKEVKPFLVQRMMTAFALPEGKRDSVDKNVRNYLNRKSPEIFEPYHNRKLWITLSSALKIPEDNLDKILKDINEMLFRLFRSGYRLHLRNPEDICALITVVLNKDIDVYNEIYKIFNDVYINSSKTNKVSSSYNTASVQDDLIEFICDFVMGKNFGDELRENLREYFASKQQGFFGAVHNTLQKDLNNLWSDYINEIIKTYSDDLYYSYGYIFRLDNDSTKLTINDIQSQVCRFVKNKQPKVPEDAQVVLNDFRTNTTLKPEEALARSLFEVFYGESDISEKPLLIRNLHERLRLIYKTKMEQGEQKEAVVVHDRGSHAKRSDINIKREHYILIRWEKISNTGYGSAQEVVNSLNEYLEGCGMRPLDSLEDKFCDDFDWVVQKCIDVSNKTGENICGYDEFIDLLYSE